MGYPLASAAACPSASPLQSMPAACGAQPVAQVPLARPHSAMPPAQPQHAGFALGAPLGAKACMRTAGVSHTQGCATVAASLRSQQPAVAAAATAAKPRGGNGSAVASLAQTMEDFVARKRRSLDERDKAWSFFLQALSSWGFFDNLPTDTMGVLHFSAPFCQEFSEAHIVLPFLAEHVLGRGKARSLDAYGCDVRPEPFWWDAWQQWTSHAFGARVQLELREQDLAAEQPREAGLILAIHPEVTNGGPWPQILENVLRSRIPGARCAFATFYEQEAQATQRICQQLGCSCEIRENPHYATTPPGASGTFLRFIVMVAP